MFYDVLSRENGDLIKASGPISVRTAAFSTSSDMGEAQDLGGYMDKTLIGIIMGSSSDWETMQHAASTLKRFGVPFEHRVVSAHRTPDKMFEYAETAKERGLACIIAGAGGAAHLPGMIASKTTVPVLGVPVPSKYLRGEDSLHSIVQMPKGIPVATFAIGEAGAANAALFAVSMLASANPALAQKLEEYRKELQAQVAAMTLPDVL